jgi:pyridoxamine 5'-phosphate oxidase
VLDDATEPFGPFSAWFAEATASEADVPDAMQLATVGPDGRPAVRTVLLKAHGPDGWVFFTHYDSPKSRDLTAQPWAAAVLHWKSLQRQVRAEGPVTRVAPAASDRYFASRDRASQLGAWASRQSAPIADRAALEAAFAEAETRFAGVPVPRPPRWGGWALHPERIEFWQGRPGRLHDRVVFAREGSLWRRSILAP